MADHPNKTFAMRGPADFLAKLAWEIHRLGLIAVTTQPAFFYQSINCAADAWHMADWVFPALPAGVQRQHRHKVAEYRKFLRRDSTDLAICREIADCVKHAQIDRDPNQQIRTSFIRREPGDGPLETSWFVLNGDQPVDLRQTFRSAHAYWVNVLIRYGLNAQTPDDQSYPQHDAFL